jgi:hypothetical protein
VFKVDYVAVNKVLAVGATLTDVVSIRMTAHVG